MTGDLPTPVKYHNDELRGAYRRLEALSADRLLALLPEDMKPAFTPYMKEEGEWLRKEVASDAYKNAKWKVVFMHIPPKPDNAEEDRAQPHFKDHVPTLTKAQPDIVLSGHDHRYQFYTREGSRAFGFDFPFVVGDSKPLKRATVERLDVKENEMALTVFRGDGVTMTNQIWRK